MRDGSRLPDITGRAYVGKTYAISGTREPVIDLIRSAIVASGGRVVSCSYPSAKVAPIFFGAEDEEGYRYGLLTYPFTTTRRITNNRPGSEHRFQIRFGEPARVREEANPLCRDPSGVDITLVLAVDAEHERFVGLDPLIYSELPMGVSNYYRDVHADAIDRVGWTAWAKEKSRPRVLMTLAEIPQVCSSKFPHL